MFLTAQSLIGVIGESRSTGSFARFPGSAGAPRKQTFVLHTSTFFQVTIEACKAFSLRCEERVTKIQQVRFD
jgi:hypothetical protein